MKTQFTFKINSVLKNIFPICFLYLVYFKINRILCNIAERRIFLWKQYYYRSILYEFHCSFSEYIFIHLKAPAISKSVESSSSLDNASSHAAQRSPPPAKEASKVGRNTATVLFE